MITLLLYIIAGICKAASDAIAHGKVKYTGPWWSNSGVAKWKNGDPTQGEAFLFSSTLLVPFTDWWHRFNFFQYLCLGLVVPAYLLTGPIVSLWVDVALWALGFRGVFEVFYRWVFTRK